jgi:hypothetical protein
MASIKLILRKHQLDQTGHCPLYYRIIKDRKNEIYHRRSKTQRERVG